MCINAQLPTRALSKSRSNLQIYNIFNQHLYQQRQCKDIHIVHQNKEEKKKKTRELAYVISQGIDVFLPHSIKMYSGAFRCKINSFRDHALNNKTRTNHDHPMK